LLATSQLNRRNEIFASMLQKHPVDTLVGDYWRVLPIRALSKRAGQNVIPLRSCFRPVDSLRSDAWQHNLLTHSFAYIVSVRPAGTPFPVCNLRTVEFMYGAPTDIQLIAGSQRNPAELLLFYNNGASDRKGTPAVPPRPVSGAPTVLGSLVYFSSCGSCSSYESNRNARRTFAVDAVTGRLAWSFPDGEYSPVVSDGTRVYLTGYTTLYALAQR